MHFNTKNYLKINRNHTVKLTINHHLSINIVMGEKGLKIQEITSLSKKMASIFCEIYFLLCNVFFMGSKTI